MSYEEIEAVNFSTLREFVRSPAHYLARLSQPRESTDAMDLGTAFHLLALEPDAFSSRVAVWEEGRRAGKAWEAFSAANAGRLVVRAEDVEVARAMAKAVRESPQVKPYLAAGQAEKTLQWEEGGQKLKGRCDYLSPMAILDLKSTRDASLEAFGRQMFQAKTHAQMAMYRQGVASEVGALMPCVLVAVENTFPHVVQCYRLTDAQLDEGRNLYRAWLATLTECQRTKKWRGYWHEETDLQFPRWAVEPEVYLE